MLAVIALQRVKALTATIQKIIRMFVAKFNLIYNFGIDLKKHVFFNEKKYIKNFEIYSFTLNNIINNHFWYFKLFFWHKVSKKIVRFF